MSKSNQTLLIVGVVAVVAVIGWQMYQKKQSLNGSTAPQATTPAPGAAQQQPPQNDTANTISAITGSVSGVADAWNDIANLF